MTDPALVPWRTGRKVGRTIYAQPGIEPADTDPLIGVMDTPELAWAAVEGHNAVSRPWHTDAALEALDAWAEDSR